MPMLLIRLIVFIIRLETMMMLFIGVIGLCGFYHKNGMTLVQIIKSTVRLIKQKPYTYETRTQNFYIELEDYKNGEEQGKHK